MPSTSHHQSIAAYFLHQVRNRPERPAIHVKRDGQYRSTSWGVLARDVALFAGVFSKLGVGRGDRVLQLSENRYEWIVTDLALQFCRAIHVPVHAPLSPPQVEYQLRHSGASVAIASDAAQAGKLALSDADLLAGTCVLTYDASDILVGGACPQTKTMAQYAETLEPTAIPDLLTDELDDIMPEAVATIIYTSGTTGEPKGVMLSNENLRSNASMTAQVFGEMPNDLRLSFLPLSHIFARTCDLYTWVVTGSELALAESRDTVVANAQELQPTLLNGVPYFFDRLQRHLESRGQGEVAGSLQRMLGGKMRACCSGGAALHNHTFDFFVAQKVPLLQGYGLTETSPVVSFAPLDCVRRGTAGCALPGVEIRLATDDEILIRGPNVMLGFWRDESATNDVILDGWFHSGDLGRIDSDGFLTITGRKKELIVTATGKNVAPVLIESLICRDPIVEQAMVIGDDRKFLTALIVVNLETLTQELDDSNQFDDSSDTFDLGHPAVMALVARRINDQLTSLAPYEQVGRFTLLEEPFTIEAGHLTPKMSLRRGVIARDFEELINAMYE